MSTDATIIAILCEHDPFDAGDVVRCGCGRTLKPGRAVHLSAWARHVAELLDRGEAALK